MTDYLINTENTLFPYQYRDMNNVIECMNRVRKTLFVAQTGYGKTFAFCTLAKYYIQQTKQKVLILCHREELCEQTRETLTKMGMTSEMIISSKRKYYHNSDVYISMEATLFNRIKKNHHFLHNVGLVIADECHLKHFNKHLEVFSEQKIIGFTATPVYTEKETFYKCPICKDENNENTECHNQEREEWSRPLTMSKFYDDVVVGAGVEELIEFGQIVRDINFTFNTDLSSLKTNSSGEFTEKSLTKAYGNEVAVVNILTQYEIYCKDLRTIIFNPSGKVNLLVYEQFKKAGYNVRIYDSVNDLDGESRKSVVKWFKETDDAILCNVSCFTTGFDCKEVQAVILNRATNSLSLFMQMVGRGARSSDKIYKDSFICVDGGGNVNRFQKWSDPTRDWQRIFWKGIGKEKAKIEQIEAVRECPNCEALTSRHDTECEVCGFIEEKVKKEKVFILSDEIAQPLETPPPPNANKIVEYAKMKKQGLNFAIKVFIEQILMLFRMHQVTKDVYHNTLKNGNFDKKIDKMSRKAYFVFISSDLEQKKNVKLVTFLDKVKKNVAQYYENI